MAKQLLDGSNVIALPEQLGSERVPQSVTRRMLVDAGPSQGQSERPLDGPWGRVETPDDAGTAIGGTLGRREHVLPAPLLVGSRILSSETSPQTPKPASAARESKT